MSIPTDISENDVQTELELLGFDVKNVKRFGVATRPTSICLGILAQNSTAADIYNLTSMFYLPFELKRLKNLIRINLNALVTVLKTVATLLDM